MSEIWLVSCCEEEWTFAEEFASREEALREGAETLGLVPGDGFWIGRKGPGLPVGPIVSADTVVEELRDVAYERVGDHAEDWLAGTTDEQIADLEQRLDVAVRAWLAEHKLEPGFFAVERVIHSSEATP